MIIGNIFIIAGFASFSLIPIKWLQNISLYGYMFGYGLSYGPISWLFIIKLLPGLSFSIIIAVENIFSTLIAYSYPALFDNI